MAQEVKVRDREGTEAFLVEQQEGEDVRISLQDGRSVFVDREMVRREQDGSYFVPVSLRQLAEQDTVIPVMREEVRVGKQIIDSKVLIHKTVEERTETIEEPVTIDGVAIERVPINKMIDEPPNMREEGDVMIFPVVEEVIVVQKRLMLKEEVHVRRIREERMEQKEVTLRSEQVKVDRER
jgi:uncharacterized protein (TIGR02271 family)